MKIDKPWCVYGGIWSYWGFGKVVEEHSSGTLEIQYSESQHYPPTYWDPRYVKRFDSLKECLTNYYENVKGRDGVNWEKVKSRASENFPGEELKDV
jgi:hypothetical protein